MSTRRYKAVEEFEEAVRKKALASKDGAFSPHDVEIAEILYKAAKDHLISVIISKDRLITKLSRGAH